ncbi:MAG: helix-turn-helix domain-containing protein [Treponema sp.]|jgi:transcriptional regulator with XRE-family HTH domain|nr:helix-turn-helix domain-containing protein [Treponema sp.]
MEGKEVRAVLAKNLKLYRGLRAMSQAALAENAGISIPFLSDIERGNKWPYMETLINIANALKIDVYELLKPVETGSNESKELLIKYLDVFSTLVHQSVDQSIAKALAAICER